MFERKNPELKGNDRYEGFCIDLIEEIAKLLKFDYVIKLVDDGKYGAPVEPRNEWNGMVGELIDKVATKAMTGTNSFIMCIYVTFAFEI